ncbi:kinase-like protein [Schizopora paradoxa]|uniref:Kinase-like protein n=1 Tax=Schizopora paradoxa TaxID=27342 RepID=A0A0H2SRS4_9AGAM|nr:kinase-like protein [Schizopora paradoxa]
MDELQSVLSRLPELNLTGQILNTKTQAAGLGGSSDVYRAWSKRHGVTVAVKRLRVFIQNAEALAAKRLTREIDIWASLEHDYVLPLLGYYMTSDSPLPCLISEWSEHGTLHVFMTTIPRGGEEAYIMVSRIAEGLDYLHSKYSTGIIHADLNSHNILISENKSPLICDFGLSRHILQSPDAVDDSILSEGGTLRWMAKELFEISDCSPSPHPNQSSDIWAFGMVIYELLSWNHPYYHLKEHQAALAIIKGELPQMPDVSDHSDVFDALWALCGKCWTERSRRPKAQEIVKSLGRSSGEYEYRAASAVDYIREEKSSYPPLNIASTKLSYSSGNDRFIRPPHGSSLDCAVSMNKFVDRVVANEDENPSDVNESLAKHESRNGMPPLCKHGVARSHPNENRWSYQHEQIHVLRHAQSIAYYMNKCIADFYLELDSLSEQHFLLEVLGVLIYGVCKKGAIIKGLNKFRERAGWIMAMKSIEYRTIMFW